jgi:hypothetical protein
VAITNSGSPSQSKTRLLAIAPTSHPSCAAAAAAVFASTSRILMFGSTPAVAIAAVTPEIRLSTFRRVWM